MRVKTLDWLLAHSFPPLCFQQSIVCCAFWRYSLTIRSAPRCAVGSVTCNAVSRRCMPSIAICASRNASTLPVMLYCLRASASAISQARSVASAICKLVDIGHQFIPAGIHPGFFGAGTRGNVPFTRHIFQGLLLIYKAKGRLSRRQPPPQGLQVYNRWVWLLQPDQFPPPFRVDAPSFLAGAAAILGFFVVFNDAAGLALGDNPLKVTVANFREKALPALLDVLSIK